LSYIAFIFD